MMRTFILLYSVLFTARGLEPDNKILAQKPEGSLTKNFMAI
jgi:hypothetical protein